MLTQAGHEVFTPTLTGVGERSHLLKLDINLDTHILDVVNEMRWQELHRALESLGRVNHWLARSAVLVGGALVCV